MTAEMFRRMAAMFVRCAEAEANGGFDVHAERWLANHWRLVDAVRASR